MRRLFSLFIVALLGLVPLGPFSVSADTPAWNEAWDGIVIPKDDPPPTDVRNDFIGRTIGEQLAAFKVLFNNEKDYIPEVANSEFMVVYVANGEFVIDVKGPGSYTIDPGIDPAIEQEIGTPQNAAEAPEGYKDIEIMVGKVSSDGQEIVYEPTGQFILDERGNRCVTLCTVLPGYAVKLMAGDRVIAPAGAICIWCLLHAGDASGDAPGVLFAYPLLRGDDFSWRQNHPNPDASASISSNFVDASLSGARPVTMGWAIGPGSNCH